MCRLMKFPLALLLLQIVFCNEGFAQNPFWEKIKNQPITLDLESGMENYTLEKLKFSILKSSQTLSALKLKDDTAFDYTPDELLGYRARDNFYHLGDINLTIRPQGDSSWSRFSSAQTRRNIKPLMTTGNILAVADMAPTLNDIPLQVIRSWEQDNGDLVLRFTITNITRKAYEIGALGIPMIFNNNMDWKSLDSAHADNVFFDPYIGKDAGYLQVNRLHGNGPSLLVLPQENAGFEAYRPLNDDPTPRSITFEGFHEWLIHSKALTQTAWKGVKQWNDPTSEVLDPGETKSYALKLVLAPSIREIEKELLTQGQPVAIGAPGYLIPQDNPAKLFIKYTQKVKRIDVYPTGSVSVKQLGSTSGKWLSYKVTGNKWGRSRLTITYEDERTQSIHYKVIKSEQRIVGDLGHFLTNEQWYDNPNDVFGRSPSVITYDYETKSHVTEHQNAWFAGLSDEAGAASWLAAIMKQLVQPDPQEINKLKKFAAQTMFGRIQHKEGRDKFGVVKSLFYYEPDSLPTGTYSDSINYETWGAWSKKEASDVGRSYNYPHVAAAHWVLYRLARNYSQLVTEETWQTYLERAFQTGVAMVEKAPHYAQFGQMEGSIFLFILMDLKKEGLLDQASKLEGLMKERALHWKTLNYPFGSEMPWDSTGQEEVYLWSRYFGFDQKAAVTLNAILAYVPAIPHWGYNGSARRYWDFVYGGKLARIERQLHHYGSALNAIPLLTAYRDNPADFYLLRVGHAGMMGALANVTQDGFAPGAFHSYPSTLANDGITGDYGSGFYGYAVNSGTYIIKHPEFGWLAFSGNLSETGGKIRVDITTASRARVFLAEQQLWVTLDAGQLKSLEYDPETTKVRLTLSASKESYAENTLLKIGQNSGYKVKGYKKNAQGYFVIPSEVKSVLLVKSN